MLKFLIYISIYLYVKILLVVLIVWEFFLYLMCFFVYNIYDFFLLGYIYLFWLWEVVLKEKGRFYIWISVFGG